MPASTIITRLTADHREVAKLFAQLEKTTPRAAQKRRELFAQVDKALTLHADFEEARVYPLLEAKKASKPTALEAVEEHGQIKRLLSQLRDLDPKDDHWMAKLTVLIEDVRHHVKEEEGEAFPQLKKAATDQELKDLGDEYEALAENPPTAARRSVADRLPVEV